ncbi:hypothetical protein [Devosia psychrophila]|uniref:Uncharacterized protein n=1 Tax=Devosia psychrophila TaxID=728005 RepID=A0A0F5PZU9_9HYPH|nr:hypothetical protein [Devosia psychrophila]KKC34202.1 hypothetical protein WH91_04255 [Devosia psychrophila]SFD43069.1 hypothetical protein SAMN04488059_1593 [Devosia psychrophila]
MARRPILAAIAEHQAWPRRAGLAANLDGPMAAEAEYASLLVAHETFISSFPEADTDVARDVGVENVRMSQMRDDLEDPEANSTFSP